MLEETIAEIKYWHRARNFAMEARKRNDLQLGAQLRTFMGWSLFKPAEERKQIETQARTLIATGEALLKDKPTGAEDTDDYRTYALVIESALAARDPYAKMEAIAVKEMERLAKLLPVWDAFGADVKGFGARSLAVIVGEAGDLSGYPKKGHLWKRMGLAVIDGTRQGGLRKTASAEAWIEHGYNRKRRSYMFVIGDVLVKQTGGVYRQVYLDRKEYEREQAVARGLTVAPAAKIPKKDADKYISDGHIHHRAQRYMEKRLLKDLWQAWRTASGPVSKEHRLTAVAEIQQQEAA